MFGKIGIGWDISDSLPAIGVMTAPVTSNAASIHAEASYEMSRSAMKSGMAGSTIVSADTAMMPKLLRTARVIHGLEVFVFLLFAYLFSSLFYLLRNW
jgi:hypothetical protein